VQVGFQKHWTEEFRRSDRPKDYEQECKLGEPMTGKHVNDGSRSHRHYIRAQTGADTPSQTHWQVTGGSTDTDSKEKVSCIDASTGHMRQDNSSDSPEANENQPENRSGEQCQVIDMIRIMNRHEAHI
jgi:hypothetical protein